MKPHRTLVSVAAIALALVSCGKKEPEWVTPSGQALRVDLAAAEIAAGLPAPGSPVPVDAERVRVMDLETGINTSGNIIPWESMLLSARMPGKLKSFPAEEGAQVLKDELIAEMETADLSIELGRAKSEAAGARTRYNRVRKLYNDAAATITQLESAQSAHKAASSALSGLEEKLSSARLTAPFAGIVARKLAAPGTVVNAGQPVAELVAISRVKIEAGFSEVEAKYLEKGRRSQITVDAYPDRKFEGEVSYVGSVVDPLTRTFPVRIAIDNGERLLKAGMSARVRILTGAYPGALTVPVGALVQDGGKTFVFITEKDAGNGEVCVRRREVEAGIPDGGVVHIKSGLTKDDSVAVRGVEKLSDGAKVRIVNVNR